MCEVISLLSKCINHSKDITKVHWIDSFSLILFFQEYTFNSHNRMHILTALMKQYSAYSPSCVSKQSRVSLCKLACLFNPFNNQYSEDMPLQFEESDSLDDDGHTCDMNSMKLEVVSFLWLLY